MSGADMRKEGNKHGKLKHYILAPFRILNKARQLYMKGVVECAGGYGYSGVGPLSPAVHYIPPPLCPNLINSSWTSGREQTVPRPVVHRRGYIYNRNRMSYSTELIRVGRIEQEDQPCYFEEDQMDVKTHLLYLYPRTRSSVINKTAVYYQ